MAKKKPAPKGLDKRDYARQRALQDSAAVRDWEIPFPDLDAATLLRDDIDAVFSYLDYLVGELRSHGISVVSAPWPSVDRGDRKTFPLGDLNDDDN